MFPYFLGSVASVTSNYRKYDYKSKTTNKLTYRHLYNPINYLIGICITMKSNNFTKKLALKTKKVLESHTFMPGTKIAFFIFHNTIFSSTERDETRREGYAILHTIEVKNSEIVTPMIQRCQNFAKQYAAHVLNNKKAWIHNIVCKMVDMVLDKILFTRAIKSYQRVGYYQSYFSAQNPTNELHTYMRVLYKRYHQID